MAGLLRLLRALGLTVIVSLAVLPVSAQDYVPAEVAQLKASPQRFWARGVVFRDILKEAPGDRPLRLDNRTFYRFVTVELGEVYAAEEAVEPLRAATPGDAYLFSGTVSQRGRQYYYIIRSIEPVKIDVASVVQQIEEINRGITDNPYNRVFIALEGIMADIQKDLFAYATARKIPVRELFDPAAGHMGKVQSSIHSALRRAEEKSRTPSQEYLVSMIVAMMAMQNGYVEAKPDTFVPDETAPETPAVLDETAPAVSEEDWDLIDQPLTEDPAAVEPAVETEPTLDEEPVMETEPAAETDVEPSPDMLEEAPAAPAETPDPTSDEPVVEQAVESTEPAAVEPAAEIVPETIPEAVADEPAADVPAEAPEVEVIGPDDPFWNDPPAPATSEETVAPAEPVSEQPAAAEAITPDAPVAAPDEGDTLPLDDPFWRDPALVDPQTIMATPSAPEPPPVAPEATPDFMKTVSLEDPPILPEANQLEPDAVIPAESNLSKPVPAGEKPKKPRKKKTKKTADEDAPPAPAIEEAAPAPDAPAPADAPQDAVDATPAAP